MHLIQCPLFSDHLYEMVGPDFLNSFVRKMAGKEKVFLNNLLNNQKLSASLSGHV
jgi:hypothetical protein